MIDKCICLGLEKVARKGVFEGQIALRRHYIFLPVSLVGSRLFFLASIKCRKQLSLIHAMSYFFWFWLPLSILAGEKNKPTLSLGLQYWKRASNTAGDSLLLQKRCFVRLNL